MSDTHARAAEARSWFADRGFEVRVAVRDMSVEFRRRGFRKAPSIRHSHWADLVFTSNPTFVLSGYGAGMTEDDAVLRAKERWLQEQGA